MMIALEFMLPSVRFLETVKFSVTITGKVLPPDILRTKNIDAELIHVTNKEIGSKYFDKNREFRQLGMVNITGTY